MISFVVISKDEPMLDQTLASISLRVQELAVESEVIVVDASRGRLDDIRRAHPTPRWFDFHPADGVGVSIPHQRNYGVRNARGEIVVFTDSGCLPRENWASTLLAPILAGDEQVTAGRTVGRGDVDLYDRDGGSPSDYLSECPTINIAFTRRAFEVVGGFDESFRYGSDVDFSWRLLDAGFRIRSVPDALVIADWGSPRRQLRRAWSYGRARARLYAKHRHRMATEWRTNPVPIVYALFLLGLPLTVLFPPFPLLLMIPALRNRRTGVALTLADHIVQGAGFLRELAQL